MGCAHSDENSRPRLASASSVSSYRGIPRLILTQSQKVLIKHTWTCLEKNMTMIGTQVFLRIFDQNHKIKELFPFRDCWGDKLISHPMFAGHAYRFMTVMKQAVERLDSIEESFSPVLLQLGASHARNHMFSSENFALFIQCMLYIWQLHLKDTMTPECREAWRTLLHYIMRRLQDGFEASAGITHPYYPPIHIDLIHGQFCHKPRRHHHQMYNG